MKVQQEKQGFLFPYDYQSDPNKVDAYIYEQKTPTPPPSPLPTNSMDSFTPTHNKKVNDVFLANSKEIDEWNLLWKDLVDLMTEITQFPSFLIQNSNDQRRSLLILAQNICEIAKNPKESQEYKDLLKEQEKKEKEIKYLQNENSELKNEIESLKLNQKDELLNLSNKIQQMENYALQIEHYTFQVDKRKEAAQVSLQKYSSKPNVHIQPTESPENTELQRRSSYPTKIDMNTNAKKINNLKNNNNNHVKKIKKKVSPTKNNKIESSHLSSPPTKKIDKFKIEENQRFEEDYISKLIQKYTKPDNENIQNLQSNENSGMPSLFDRSLKPNEDRETKNRIKKGRRRRAWH